MDLGFLLFGCAEGFGWWNRSCSEYSDACQQYLGLSARRRWERDIARRAGRVTLCFCFLRGALEEGSELTNVGALKIAETLEQHDATAEQSVITFR